MFECPWCSESNVRAVSPGADIDVACSFCKKPIDLKVDPFGGVVRNKRLVLDSGKNDNKQSDKQNSSVSTAPSIQIGTNYGPVAFGGNASMTINLYEQTIKEVEQAKNIDPEQKKQATGILTHVNTYAKPFLPVIAAAVKHGLGLV